MENIVDYYMESLRIAREHSKNEELKLHKFTHTHTHTHMPFHHRFPMKKGICLEEIGLMNRPFHDNNIITRLGKCIPKVIEPMLQPSIGK
jgi:hypothetical protein